MGIYSLRVLGIHLTITLAYQAYFCYKFVVGRHPNPIGIGLFIVLCMFVHFFTALIVSMNNMSKADDRKTGMRKLVLNMLILVVVLASMLLFSTPVWGWLWDLRDVYHPANRIHLTRSPFTPFFA
jgi:hypothetical protein